MKKQYGKIGAGMIALISVVAIVVIIGGTTVGSYFKYFNYGATAENTIKAQYENMENVLGQYSLKVKEAAQIPAMQKDDLLALYTGANESRYGKGGSKGAMQWIKEQNPTLDQATYLKIQQIIEAGRNKFENSQTKFIDTKRQYQTKLDMLWSGLWLGIANYPKMNLADYTIVSSTHAKETMKSGIDNGLQIR